MFPPLVVYFANFFGPSAGQSLPTLAWIMFVSLHHKYLELSLKQDRAVRQTVATTLRVTFVKN